MGIAHARCRLPPMPTVAPRPLVAYIKTGWPPMRDTLEDIEHVDRRPAYSRNSTYEGDEHREQLLQLLLARTDPAFCIEIDFQLWLCGENARYRWRHSRSRF